MIVINTADLFGKRNLISFKMAFGSLKWNWGRNARGWITYGETEFFLKSNGVNVQKDILNGLSHSIDSKVIDLIVKIIRQFFPL